MALMIKTSKCCYFCDNNSVTKNKEFTGKSCFTADSIVLAELLKSVGLDIDANTSSSPPAACKKCARKIVDCSTLFHELERIVKVKTSSNSQSVKRLHGNHSPSGSTPDPKKAKDIAQEPQELQEPRTKATHKSSEEILIWVKRNLGWARESRRCCSVVAFIFQTLQHLWIYLVD